MRQVNQRQKMGSLKLAAVLFVFSLMIFLSVFSSMPAQAEEASDAQMKETLVRIINQLQSIKPLISQAKREQSANPRIKVHFDRFKGADGKYHNGLWQDVDEMQQALILIVNQESIEPKTFQAMSDDYVGQ